MKTTLNIPFITIVLASLMMTAFPLQAQLIPGIYEATVTDGSKETIHSLKVGPDYIIHNAYRADPPEFVSSWGGFYTISDDEIAVKLEFNSSFESDQMKHKDFSYGQEDGQLLIDDLRYNKSASSKQALDGYWLFATRGPDTGQERRGDDRPRKTLKVLMDGSFQWIAYHTESFKFLGTGGGSYTADDGTYSEHIEFFSRDNTRVGAKLEFQYSLEGNDWHHNGKNSRGEPMYEIWSKR
ncbi:MAG: hypothetical protein ABF295_07145 [Flavobacteriaceae bacterium]